MYHVKTATVAQGGHALLNGGRAEVAAVGGEPDEGTRKALRCQEARYE